MMTDPHITMCYIFANLKGTVEDHTAGLQRQGRKKHNVANIKNVDWNKIYKQFIEHFKKQRGKRHYAGFYFPFDGEEAWVPMGT